MKWVWIGLGLAVVGVVAVNEHRNDFEKMSFTYRGWRMDTEIHPTFWRVRGYRPSGAFDSTVDIPRTSSTGRDVPYEDLVNGFKITVDYAIATGYASGIDASAIDGWNFASYLANAVGGT